MRFYAKEKAQHRVWAFGRDIASLEGYDRNLLNY
jgi:hypothetical protein